MRAMTTSMDTVIGKVLEAVDSIPSDTYVIYIGDNGTPMYSNQGVLGSQIGNMYITRAGRGKGTAYESGARVPMAIRGPGIAAGSKSSEFVHAADLFSTILALAGLTPPEEVPNSAWYWYGASRFRFTDPDPFRHRFHRARPERRLHFDGITKPYVIPVSYRSWGPEQDL